MHNTAPILDRLHAAQAIIAKLPTESFASVRCNETDCEIKIHAGHGSTGAVVRTIDRTIDSLIGLDITWTLKHSTNCQWWEVNGQVGDVGVSIYAIHFDPFGLIRAERQGTDAQVIADTADACPTLAGV